MDVDAVPTALAARLGPEATGGFLHVLDLAEREWSDDMMTMAGERFERRFAEQGSSLRIQIAQTEVALRKELGQFEAGLRQDFAQMEVRVLREIGNNRFELLKWSFLFWIGQVVTMSAIIAAMLRSIR